MLGQDINRKDYKLNSTSLEMDKRGQVTLFIIVAVIIVGVAVAVFLTPRIQVYFTDVEPNSFLKDCIEQDAREIMNLLAENAGYDSPPSFVEYQGEKFTYLCYTSEFYETCTVQQPLIKRNYELELKKQIEPRARACVEELVEAYESRGYDVQSTPGELNVSFIPGSLMLDFVSPLTVTKENRQTFQKFSTSINTEMYDLIFTAQSIVASEAVLGNAETLLYLQYYPDLKIEKILRDGDTIYILENVISEDKFQFATRSLVWPQGYGVEN